VRVGVLTTSYPRDDEDPAGAFVAGFARWLADRVEVEVLCADERRPLFYRGGAPLGLRRQWRGAVDFSARLLAAAAWRGRRWDAVVSHWLVPSGAAGFLACGKLPHLAVAHGSDVRLLQKLPGGTAVVRQIAAGSDLVYVAEHLRVDGAPGRVVPMGVDVAAWRGGDRAGARRALGLGGFTILYMGRLIDDKGVDRAIDALPDRAELLIAGEGPARAELEARARGRRVRFLGEVRGRDKRDLLAAADVLVVPSRIDGAPTVIFEAWAAGLPVAPLEELTRLRDDPKRLRDLRDEAAARASGHDWSVVAPKLGAHLGLPRANRARRPIEVIRV
jgi:glycosyltransferase involved in cell wall biosynthesis